MSFGPAWRRVLQKNPVLARESRGAIRSGRIIVLVLLLALLTGLFVLAVGAAVGMGQSPVRFGPALFQAFFSLAYFTVTLLGPTLMAVAFVVEREPRLWDALVMTGMNARLVVRGKLSTAALVAASFLALIAPASLLCVLLGGVTIAEIAVAFVLLGAIAAIAAGFGSAVGTLADTPGSATFAALGSALVGAPVLYLAIGVGGSFLAHATWGEVPAGFPVWLPLAYARARFDGWYVLLLLAVPAAVVALSTWFFYEIALLRLTDETEDRSTRLKRWFLVALPLVTVLATIPGIMTRGAAEMTAWMGGLGGLLAFVVFAELLFVGDALSPSRRVEFRWSARNAGWLSRLLGPGLVQTCMIVLVAGLLAIGVLILVGGVFLSRRAPRGGPAPAAIALLTCGEYWSAFLVFWAGFLVWSRMRAGSASAARLLSTAVAALALSAPWAASGALARAANTRPQAVLALGAASPLHAFGMMSAIERGEPHLALTSGLVCSLGWTSMGIVLFGLGARRVTRAVAEQRTLRASLETPANG